jgi:DNA-binding transcriptional LysR family regulator
LSEHLTLLVRSQTAKKLTPAKRAVSVFYLHSRQLSPRVRVFIDWIVQRFSISGANK